MTYIAAPGKFGVSRVLINSGAGDVAAKGTRCCECRLVHASACVSPVAVLTILLALGTRRLRSG
jgi:hypothetical protein